jgi:hypothetical protein
MVHFTVRAYVSLDILSPPGWFKGLPFLLIIPVAINIENMRGKNGN